jgi:hypothetical protein
MFEPRRPGSNPPPRYSRPSAPPNPPPPTYEKPPHGWTCFHCGETFTTVGSARTHFGASPDAQPGCIERVRLGGERGLLAALRKAEERIAQYIIEDTEAQRAMHTQQSRHSEALLIAEEAGYERGLRDARKQAEARS